MKNIFKIFVLLVLFLPGCVFVELPGVRPLVEKTVEGEGRDKILLIDVSGVISTEEPDGVLGITSKRNITGRIKEELVLAEKDRAIKAVVLRINTPGGAVTACDIISHEIVEFRKKKKVPVVAQLMDLSTSGGYYIAASADKVVAHPTTITGSIGAVAVCSDARG